MTKGLFSEFDPVSSKQWKQKIQYDLMGADYNSALIWNSNEDIAVKPFYHADDFSDFPEISNTKATAWKIAQQIFVADVEKSNLHAVDVLKRGADVITFIIPSENVSVERLIENIDTKTTTILFQLQFLSESYIENLLKTCPNSSIEIDIINRLAETGNWFENLQSDFQSFRKISPKTASFSVDASLYQNAGANMVQQLAYALAHAHEYLTNLDNNQVDLTNYQVTFKVTIGSNYFFEIAKLKALRLLWESLALEYGIPSTCNITATPTKRNKTIYEAYNNLLRSTTECMSAILGGADTIYNLPYDDLFKKTNEFSERIARNQLLILKHESYFNAVNNPSDGAYYVESLTNQLAEKALNLFKDIERNGGFLRQLKAGTIQRKIKESEQKEVQQFDQGDHILIGSNLHPNPEDKMKDKLELYPFVKTNPRKTLIEPIIEKRLAALHEQKRLKNEN
ncbi:methylmalonyl-CoA mutase subunit beta [Tamlana sp. s12]|uniref:methylmalonyl-CoA mutase subunit beta n=1 Tax=Tamlana sp. s12 TaxID=1630406 RepID=UPI0007FEE39D|nr:methylmalonyl-CoA mutase subunit beta [Tamlana sp. s12]OBQ55924.1 methylmalonyl-CoA mutase [Tamlana sp. s12]QQY83571.1 methylmalonyl-CoA mutase subunit beta [Tamlana sp. s12]